MIDNKKEQALRCGGGSAGNRSETKKRVIYMLLAYFEKYLDLAGLK